MDFKFSVQGSFVGSLYSEAPTTVVAGGQHMRGVGCALGMGVVHISILVPGVLQFVLSLPDQLTESYLPWPRTVDLVSLLSRLVVLPSSGLCPSLDGASLPVVADVALIDFVLSLPLFGLGHLLKGGFGGLCVMLFRWFFPVCMHLFS